jgi:hypothetical protein
MPIYDSAVATYDGADAYDVIGRSIPVYRPQVAWSAALTGVFRTDISLTDGDDVTPGTFGNNAFDDILDPQSIAIERGRSTPFSGIEQGTCRLVCSDPDGIYDPTNEDSPLYGLIDDMRPMRVPMDHDGGTDWLFYGFTTSVQHFPEFEERVSIIEGVDFTEWLATIKPTIASTGPTTIGGAIGKVLDAAEWTAVDMRDLDAGNAIPDFSADGSKSGLLLVGELIQIDLGHFYVDGAGVVTYRSRGRMFRRAIPVDTFASDTLIRVRPSIDSRNACNRQTVTRTGGVAQTASYNPNRKPWRDGSPITSPYLVSDSEALALAQWTVAYKQASQVPIPVEVADWDDEQIARMAARELADLVTLELPYGAEADAVVQALSHRISVDRRDHVATYSVAIRPATFMTTDVSTTDGPDVCGY